MAGLSVTLDGEPLGVAGIGAAASTRRVTPVFPPSESSAASPRAWARDRFGWRTATSQSGSGGARSPSPPRGRPSPPTSPATSPSGVLTSYPDDETPLDVRTAIVEVGSGSVVVGGATIGAVERLGSVIRFDRFGPTAALAALAAAVALGAGHALAPGHGKTIVAAYLVGTRGTMSQALLLAGTTAVSHTLGVAVLGVVVATAASSFDPARLYPYLSALAGVVVLAIGARLLWMALRRGRRDHHEHDHHHHHDQPHPASRSLGWRSVAALVSPGDWCRPPGRGAAARSRTRGPGVVRDSPHRRVRHRDGRCPGWVGATRRRRPSLRMEGVPASAAVWSCASLGSGSGSGDRARPGSGHDHRRGWQHPDGRLTVGLDQPERLIRRAAVLARARRGRRRTRPRPGRSRRIAA